MGVGCQEADCRAPAAVLGWNGLDVYVDNDLSAYRASGGPNRNGYSPTWARAELRPC